MARPNNPTLRLLVDTDAFVALTKVDDPSHERATAILSELEQYDIHYVTSNYIFSEAVTVISQRVSHSASLAFIEGIQLPTSAFPITWITPEVEAKAVTIFKRQTSKNVSFVDCTNMALLDFLNLDGLFSFDKAYQTNGYSLVEDFITRLSQ